MMSTITKNIKNWESFEGKWEKLVGFEENICHLSFNFRKEQNLGEKCRKLMGNLLFFEGKWKKLLTFGKKICQKNF